VVKYGGIYIGALGNTKQHLLPFNLLDLGEAGRAFLVTEDYDPLVEDSAAIKAANIDLDYTGADYKLTGTNNEFILVGESSHRGSFGLAATIPNSAVLENLPFLRRIVMGITIGALIILPIILYLLRKLILAPVNRIIRAMRRIEDGNLDVRINPAAPTLEFRT
jgi:two-component system sensor histidine kinase YesM